MAAPTKTDRQKLFKAGKCQRCGKKVGKANLFTVRYTDRERTKVVVEEATAESRNHFCEEHAEARRKVKQRSVEARAAAAKNGKPTPAAKPKAKRAKAKAK